MRFVVLKENILQNEEHRQNVHNGVNILCFFTENIDNNVGDDTYGDTLGNAVEQRHCDHAKISGNSGGIVLGVDLKLTDVAEHKESND